MQTIFIFLEYGANKVVSNGDEHAKENARENAFKLYAKRIVMPENGAFPCLA